MKKIPNLGFLIISRDRKLDLIRTRLKEIKNQNFKASGIIVCVDRPEFVTEVIEILKDEDIEDFNVVQLYDFDYDDIEIVDECYRYCVGYMAIFESDYMIPKQFSEGFSDLLEEGHMITYMQPYSDQKLSGMVIHCPIFKLLHGNKPVIHPDGTRDNRTFEERVAEMTEKIEGII